MSTQIKLIAYRRVSTQRQGDSGLGIEGQDAAIQKYALHIDGEIINTYTEIESGKKDDRPELARAMAQARRINGRLVIAKLDRLTRNARFLLGIVESGAEVVFCELPDVPPGPMGKFFLTMMAAVAELERGLISERTRTALAAYKAGKRTSKRINLAHPDGVPPEVFEATAGKLGSHLPQCRDNLKPEARRKGSRAAGVVARKGAEEAYADLMPEVLVWRAEGLSQRGIAAKLNALGHRTRRGKPWTQPQVLRILRRFG